MLHATLFKFWGDVAPKFLNLGTAKFFSVPQTVDEVYATVVIVVVLAASLLMMLRAKFLLDAVFTIAPRLCLSSSSNRPL